MDLRHLRYFVAVVDAGGISRAAARLRLTQPGLSRQLRDLEAELGVALFDRVGRRVELTASGEDLLRRSRDLLATADELVDRAHALQRGDAGIIRIGATPQMTESVLAGFLRRYRAGHPRVDVHLVEAGGLELLRRLERGEVHLALSIPDAAFEHRLLFPARLLAVTTKTHALARFRTLGVKQLAGHPVVVLRRDFGSRAWFDGACQLAQINPRIVLESASAHALVELARADYGVAIVPSTVRIGAGVHVAPVTARGRAIGRWLAVNWDPRRHQAAYARACVDELVAHTRRSHPGQDLDRIAPVPRAR